jgi:hypothetical protein
MPPIDIASPPGALPAGTPESMIHLAAGTCSIKRYSFDEMV